MPGVSEQHRESRREFLRLIGVASLGGFAAACAGSNPRRGGGSPTPTSGTSTPSATAAGGYAWRRLAARGPAPRRDYSFAGSGDGRKAFLFGGRANGKPLNDLWEYDVAAERWTRVASAGPSARFGASTIFAGGRLLVFGGQAGPDEFFNDLWGFDPATKRWSRVNVSGAVPAPRYGAGGANIDSTLLLTHGFTNSGRFDDTWSFDGSWRDRKPSGRPIKRCLHRFTYVPEIGKAVLFAGQTNSDPFLDDTWTFDPAGARWSEVKTPAPPARTIYAAAGLGKTLHVFGGQGERAPLNDLWSFDGTSWREESASGTSPEPRSGIEGALAGDRMLVFGGAGSSGELNDLWELTLPAGA